MSRKAGFRVLDVIAACCRGKCACSRYDQVASGVLSLSCLGQPFLQRKGKHDRIVQSEGRNGGRTPTSLSVRV